VLAGNGQMTSWQYKKILHFARSYYSSLRTAQVMWLSFFVNRLVE